MKIYLSEKILERIIKENEFSLMLSLHLKRRQDSVIRMAKKNHPVLRLPEQIEFYKKYGYTMDDILVKE